jgi:predicted metal-dependent peptidase
MEKEPDFQRHISSTILKLRLRSPFFATLALFARVLESNFTLTASTDGRDIFIHRAFWDKLTPAYRLGVFAHEVLHAALLHVPRRGAREPLLWNIAADIVVNGMLIEAGFELPPRLIRDQQLEHLSVEEIYHKLLDSAIKYELIDGGDLIWRTDLDPDQYKGLEGHWQVAIQQARMMAQMQGQGNLPASLERELANLNLSQLDWRSYLWRFLVRTPTDFQEYDRRFIGQRLYLDALADESVRVYIAVDTSGSVGQKEMGLFLGEVAGILNAYPHIIATLYYADAACYGPYPLTGHSELPRPVGGGGTSFCPFFETIQHEHDESTAGICVYLTDGYGTFPSNPPTLPVLWVLAPGGSDTRAVPFGEAVRLIPDP